MSPKSRRREGNPDAFPDTLSVHPQFGAQTHGWGIQGLHAQSIFIPKAEAFQHFITLQMKVSQCGPVIDSHR